MRDLKNLTLGDVTKGLSRYRPFLALLAAVLLVVTLSPGAPPDEDELSATGPTASSDLTTTDTAVDGSATIDPSLDATVDTTVDAGATTGTGAGGTSGGTAGAAPSATGGGRAGGTGGGGAAATPQDGPIAVSGEPGPECDPATGRLRMPTKYAPPCRPKWSGGTNNGGATAPGVTADQVTLVYYRPKQSAATEAALQAAGASDSPEQAAATIKDYVELFSKHYEMYGRKPKLIIMDGTGDGTDDAAGKADAITIATQHKAFAVIGDPNNAFVDELVARKIICICTTSQPQEFYEARSPYAGYTGLMSSTQGYVHRAEYIGKRLAGDAPKWADATMTNDPTYPKQRRFGLLYFETKDRAYEAGVKFFQRELKSKYNVELAVAAPFTGAIGPGADPAETQRQAGPLITKLKEAKVTTVMLSCDPLSPAIITSEATNQQYFPEWLVIGSALTDTTLFGRTYDKTQWRRAFGISFLTARAPQEEGDSYKVHTWHFGRPPTAENAYSIIYGTINTFFQGVHMAGPDLNPSTWQRGLFSIPVTGAGGFTNAASSFGDHGLWDFLDFTNLDDVTEIWWDDQAQGEDETGAAGVGMYQYVDGGVRYLPGQHPDREPKVFDRNGAVTTYNTRPAADKAPDYPHDENY